MAWQVSQRDGKYRLWSTVSSQFLTGWLTRKEVLRHYYLEAQYRFKQTTLEAYLRFPHEFVDHDTPEGVRYIGDELGHQAHCAFLAEVLEAFRSGESEVYAALIDQRWGAMLKDLEIEEEPAKKRFYCSECKTSFKATGFRLPTHWHDTVADCPTCGQRCWEKPN